MNAPVLDVLVAGGGPSGLATAIGAAQRGLSVAVIEPRDGIIDKACGEGLMPGAIRELDALGVDIPRSHPFRGIAYVRNGQRATGDFPDGEGLGVRRTVLHGALLDRADALGVRQIDGRVSDIVQDAHHVVAEGHRARYLVAADGLHSPIRKQLGLDRPSTWRRRFGLRQHFAVQPWTDRVEVHWSDDVEAYVTPVDDELVGLAFLFDGRAVEDGRGKPGRPIDRLLARFPDLERRLHSPTNKPRGAGPFAHNVAHRVEGRVLLVGDAAGYLDPLTGEGIKLGLRASHAALDAIEADRPEDYEAAWARLYRPYALSTGGLLLATRPRWARRALVPVLKAVPPLMGAVLRVLGD